jgi:hypothetical protein
LRNGDDLGWSGRRSTNWVWKWGRRWDGVAQVDELVPLAEMGTTTSPAQGLVDELGWEMGTTSAMGAQVDELGWEMGIDVGRPGAQVDELG